MQSDAAPIDAPAGKPWLLSYLAIVFAMMTMQASSLGFAPLIPAMKQDWGMNYTQVGTFTGVYGLVGLVMSVPAGLLIKRFGEKLVLMVGLSLAVLGLAAVSISQDYLQGLSSRTLWIFGYRMAFVSVVAGVAVTAPANWRGKAMGVVGAMSALATMIGAPTATLLESSFGWRTGMRAFAALALLGVLVFTLIYRQRIGPLMSAQDPRKAPAPGMFAAFRLPIVWTIPLLGLTNAAGFGATFFVPSVVTTHFHLGVGTASLIIGVAYGVAIGVNPLCGWLSDRHDRWYVMAGMVALMIPACIAMQSSNIYVFAASAIALISLGHASANQVYPAAAELLKGREVGPIMGIVALGGGIFGYLGPQLLGWMRQASNGFSLGWWLLAAASTLVFFLLLFLKGYARRNHARLAAA